jgi:hypothetical protein
MMTLGLSMIALGLMGVALAAAVGALMARSLFAMIMHLIACAAAVAVCVLLRGGGEGALAIALVGAAWAPVLLLAAMLLSARAVKPGGRRIPWLTAAAAALMAAATWAPLGELIAAAPTARAAPIALGFWLAPLLLVTGAACAGLIGFGERGVLSRSAHSE